MWRKKELSFLFDYLPIIVEIAKLGGEFEFKDLQRVFSRFYILSFLNAGYSFNFLEKKNGKYRLNIKLPKSLTFSIDEEINENALLVKNGIQILVE
ncbi:hypothetical protein DRP05_01695 [Archaeoglobales archaeon]|nr:MAG: hypothetical protein DRP05_01695 [Archaeoglobales archaeon]